MIDLSPFVDLRNEVRGEKGDFLLFALLLREDAPGKWDLVVSAGWMEADQASALHYLSKKVTGILSPLDLLLLSRIVILEIGNPTLEAILRACSVTDSLMEIRDTNLGGLQIRHGYVLEAKRPLVATLPSNTRI